MKFSPLPMKDAFLVSLDLHTDMRGAFARAFCKSEFKANGIDMEIRQANISINKSAGIVRGLHFQHPPHAEIKLIRCIRGAVFDVIVDMRRSSPTFGKWFGTELSEGNGLLIVVPKGFAHGYQALCDGATLYYMVSADYAPEAEGGLRHNDPRLGIKWPLPVSGVSEKDMQWPLLSSDGGGIGFNS